MNDAKSHGEARDDLAPLAEDLLECGSAIAAAVAAEPDPAVADVSPPQLRALFALQREGEINLSRLAVVLGIRPPSATRLCDRLVVAGLISRQTAESSRREVSLRLTPHGERVMELLRTQQGARLTAILARMPDRARRQLIRGVRSFAEAKAALEENTETAGDAPSSAG